jgi:hypothetical protein
MKTEVNVRKTADKTIIKKCHLCGLIMMSSKEIKKCKQCNKSFLPLNYFGKIHAKNTKEFEALFCTSDELDEKDLIKGLMVLW